MLTESQDSVDGLLAKFYRSFPWPWQPIKFDYLEDTDFSINMLNQDIGDFTHRTVPRNAKIWVAGCGTNQALHTALKFPHASVVGSDLSSKSLELCAKNAKESVSRISRCVNKVSTTFLTIRSLTTSSQRASSTTTPSRKLR